MSRSAIAAPLRRRPSMSALITRASISSVTPGRVAIRTPASVAALRARGVRERLHGRAEHDVGRRHRRGDRGRRLGAVRLALGDQRQHRRRRRRARPRPQPLAEPDRRRVGDHEHLLALADAEAVADRRRRRRARGRSSVAVLALALQLQLLAELAGLAALGAKRIVDLDLRLALLPQLLRPACPSASASAWPSPGRRPRASPSAPCR